MDKKINDINDLFSNIVITTFDDAMAEGFNKENIYSFSKLNSFGTCHKEWYQTYVLEDRGAPNCFGIYGSFCHQLLDDYQKEHKTIEDILETYRRDFNAVLPEGVKMIFSGGEKDLTDGYFNAFINYLMEYDDFGGLKVLNTEEKFYLKLTWNNGDNGDTPKSVIYNGIIDVVATDDNGDYYIIDYKSKSKFNSKKELQAYARQLYTYSLYVYLKYGKFPKGLIFEQFRIKHREIVLFNNEDLAEAVSWMKDTVKAIEEEIEFGKNENSFYCNNLCSHRFTCQ